MSFSLEEGADHFWICDHGRRVVLVVRMPAGGYVCNAVFLRQEASGEPVFPSSYHSATAIGVQADIRWRWGQDWLPMECAFEELAGPVAKLVFSRRSRSGRNEQRVEVSLRRVSPGSTGYLLNFRTRLLGDTPEGLWIEFLNLLPADAGHSSPERKRFRSTIHETSPGCFERRPHSQLNVLERYYWPDADGFRRAGLAEPPFAEIFAPEHRHLGSAAPFAVSHLFKPLAPGGVLIFTGERVTPALRVVGSNSPVQLMTCDVWYDEHFGIEQGVRQADGRFLYEAEYELFAFGSKEGRRLEDSAATVPLASWIPEGAFAPFFLDRVNRFDRPAAAEYDGATGLFFAYEDPHALISWHRGSPTRPGAIVLNTVDPIEPPSGQHYQSSRYALGSEPWAEAFPLGFALHLDLGHSLAFSAAIEVDGEANAYVEIREAFWGKFHQEHRGEAEQHAKRTEAVGPGAVARVSGQITARIEGSLLMVFLVIRGRGRARFAELLVQRS